MSGSFIPEERPTKSDASIRAMKALSLNRAMSTTRPATAMKAQTNRLVSRLKPGSKIIVGGQQVATIGPSSRHGRRGPPNRRNEGKANLFGRQRARFAAAQTVILPSGTK